ncbi:MAG: hypothetical protein U9Q07_03885 [Planctomycetota bacterium]|nr:hypothetical protein [Planctomycetota bacterium]
MNECRGKPPEATRMALKARGFRWASGAGAWQRRRTRDALDAARLILKMAAAGDE